MDKPPRCRRPRSLTLRLLLAALALAAGPAPAQPEPARIWRVCITDLAVPPYLNNDPQRLGVAERILLDAGREAGLGVMFLRYPVRRCAAMLDGEGVDAMLASPVARNQAKAMQFPQSRGGAVDAARRLARVNLVWVRRADATLNWDGTALTGVSPGKPPLVGTRAVMNSVIEPLRTRGFEVDDTAISTRQLLMKVAARRVDLAVGMQEEVEFALSEVGVKSLVVLPRAFSSSDYYAAVRPHLAPELQDKVEAWWTAIGRLRESPEYRVR
ncbi:hypothetical protein [Roseateles violae]|uniref:Solute-binding protein family 3/N-terminal domain-containing protein n=1 Tax=Roseateles violae TaxID=3058042 RepID=A0ABT8DQS4_9BURK|nr:hypothetical protein [Pelomonas sp. PFR6]MDN3919410.1 hypothetical protein [Pelomonas sp. PFR6]